MLESFYEKYQHHKDFTSSPLNISKMWAQLDKVEPSMLEEQRTEFENNLKRLTEGMILDEIILVEMLCVSSG